MKRFFREAVILLLLSACSGAREESEKYFDFDALLDTQINELTRRKLRLEKSAEMSRSGFDSTFVPSKVLWRAELEIFRQLEVINRPAYQKAYAVEGPSKDTRSNLKILRYVSDAAPVHQVTFYYQDELSALKRIEAMIMEHNPLYVNSRVLVMEFEEEDGSPLLTRYGMQGFQKMALSDTVKFLVSGKVNP